MKPATHARLLNAISFVVGSGISLGLFLSIAQFLSVQESAAPEMPEEDLETFALSMQPPPPPPPERPDDEPAVVAEMPDAIALGFQEEPSASPVHIPPSPPSLDELLPVIQVPAHVVSGVVGLETSFKPTIAVSLDTDRVYQKSEVDKPPFLISRPDPPVPAHLLNLGKELAVVVLFIVDAHGVVGHVQVLRSSGNAEFDSIIAESVLEWKFSPAVKKGRPVRCMVQQLARVQSRGYRDPFSL